MLLFSVQAALRSHHGKYVCAEQNHKVAADRSALGAWEQWQVIPVGSHCLPAGHHHAPPPQVHYQPQQQYQQQPVGTHTA